MGGHSYTYDGANNRISQTVDEIVTSYLLDVQPGLVKVLAETTGGNTKHYLFDQRGILAQEDSSGNWVRPIHDGLGSVRAEVNDALEVSAMQHYTPPGVPYGELGTFGTPFMFTGEMMDSNGLEYLRARYYNPGLGVFPSLDPMENLNRYQYVNANPINQRDPSGLQSDECGQYWGSDPQGYAECTHNSCPPGWLDTGNFTYPCRLAPSASTTADTAFTSAKAWEFFWSGRSDAEAQQLGYHGGTALFFDKLAVDAVKQLIGYETRRTKRVLEIAPMCLDASVAKALEKGEATKIGIRLDLSAKYGFGTDANLEVYCTPSAWLDIGISVIDWPGGLDLPRLGLGRCGYFLNLGAEFGLPSAGVNLGVLIGRFGFPDAPGEYVKVWSGGGSLGGGLGLESDLTWTPADNSWVFFLGFGFGAGVSINGNIAMSIYLGETVEEAMQTLENMYSYRDGSFWKQSLQ